MGTPLLRGRKRHDLYEWPLAHYANKSHLLLYLPMLLLWLLKPHGIVVLVTLRIFNKLVQSSFVSLSSSSSCDLTCHSCLCNKSYRLPFGDSTLQRHAPLELIYTNVWGLSLFPSLDSYHYYVIFIDHFTKYIWFYPLRLNIGYFTIFRQFKAVVEFFFHYSIVSIYSDGGGEYIALKDFLCITGIQHLKTPSYIHQHNDTIERRHKHIVGTGLTLLYHTKLPLKFWTYEFQIAVYLINCLSNVLLHFSSPY